VGTKWGTVFWQMRDFIAALEIVWTQDGHDHINHKPAATLRYRTAHRAGLREVPVCVATPTDEEALETHCLAGR
jgi:hypothetical protein